MAEEQGQAAQPQPSVEERMEAVAEGILSQEGAPTPRDEKGKFTSATPKPEAEAQPETEAEAPKAEEPAPEEGEQPAETEAQQARRLKLKYNGEEREVEEAEAIELAQKGYDYTQKMQKLANERAEAQREAKAYAETSKAEYEKQLKVLEQSVLKMAEGEAFNVDLIELSKTDPAKAQELFFRQQRVAQTIGAIQQEQARLAQSREAEQRAALQKQAKEAVEILQAEIPGWNNDVYGKILKFGVDVGFKPEEVNAITDPRAIKVLNDARLYRESKAKPVTEKRVAAPAPKVIKPSAAKDNDAKADKWKAAKEKLAKTGKGEDATALFDQILERSGAFK